MASQDWVNKDFYAILGVSKDASEADIKKAYRKLAREHHPDQNQGDAKAEHMFKDVTEAYSVLSDPQEREQYDAIRAMGSGARFSAGGPSGAGSGSFDDLFGGLFGARSGARQASYTFDNDIPPEFMHLFGEGNQGAGRARGGDRTAETTISFAGSLRGTTARLRDSNGEIIEVRVPAGIREGQKVRVRGKGQSGGASSGDLYVTIHITPHPFFTREGNNIRVRVPLTFPEAALGASIEVPTVDGTPVRVKVPAGTPSGRTLRVKGRGVSTKSGAGDMLVTVEVAVPQKMSKGAQQAVEAFAKATESYDPRSDLSARSAL